MGVACIRPGVWFVDFSTEIEMISECGNSGFKTREEAENNYKEVIKTYNSGEWGTPDFVCFNDTWGWRAHRAESKSKNNRSRF